MEALKTATIAVLGLPLLGASIACIFGNFIGKRITHSLVILLLGIACTLSCCILCGFITNSLQSTNVTLYTWGMVGGHSLQIGLLIDPLSALMLALVSIISLAVHVYSINFMHNDSGYQRFFCYISFFTFAMLVLVVANNFLQLFFAWEMVGLASYLLIGFWFTKSTAVNAGFKAFLINRVSDFGFLLAIVIIFCCYNSLNYSEIFPRVTQLAAIQNATIFSGVTWPAINIICLLLLIGALGKSAQLPLHTWLPNSMAGPLPVSALIHAATMVTAGVFMIARVSPLFECSAVTLNIMLILGAVTCIAMSMVAVVQYDIKQILAYSTISQLGLMLAAMGASAYTAGIFHLVTHAFFKASLFLGAGVVIMALNNQQDLRKMGGLGKQLPFVYLIMLIASLAAVGFPGFSGFYSKDLVLSTISNSSATSSTGWVYYILLFNMFVTALYTFRMFFLMFHGERSSSIRTRSSMLFKLPLIVLAIPTLAIGWISDAAGSTMLHGFISLPFGMILLGVGVAWLCYIKQLELWVWLKKILAPICVVLTKKYWFDEINNFIVAINKMFGQICFQIGDRFIIESLLVKGTVRLVNISSRILRGMQTGYLYHYLLVMIIGLILLLYLLCFGTHGCG